MENQAKKYYIAVTGLLGSGKSTLSGVLAEEFGAKLFREEFGKNAFLALYYQAPKRWALHNQLFFMAEKASQMGNIRKALPKNHIVQDVPPYQDFFTYAKGARSLGYLSAKEFSLYRRIFEIASKNFPKPDLIVSLDISLPALEKRIRERERDFEKSVSREYLGTLLKFQEKWLSKTKGIKILRVKVDNGRRDLLANEAYRRELVAKIRRALSE